MRCGDTLLIPAPAPGSTITPHLWIIVTEPDHDHRCVIVNLTTLRGAQDQTVTLAPGDHPFINRATSVRYSDARFADVQKLRMDIASGLAVAREPCSPGLLRLGILPSPHTPTRSWTSVDAAFEPHSISNPH